MPGLSEAVSPSPFTTAFPAVNTFTVSGVSMPGKWTLLAADKVFGWQIQQGYGLSGAFVFPKGDELVKPKFKGEFWAQTDFILYQQIRKRLLKKPVISLGAVSAALGISHPELKALGVEAVVVLKTGPVIQSEGGLWTTEIEFLQYRAPLPPPPKPNQATPDVSPPIPTAKNAQEVEIQRLQAQAKALLGKP